MTTLCPERELLPEYLTERLSSTDADRVHTHLATCAVCRRLADELEVGLAALAIARDEAQEHEREAVASASAAATVADDRPADLRARPRRRWVPIAAAACAAAIVGAAAGVVIERQTAADEILAEFPLLNESVIDPASGSATLALADGGLKIGLDLEGLPTDADYFECLWHVEGDTRSAGTFDAVAGAVDVDLVVAPFEGIPTWTLDIVAHTGDDERVVLTAER